MPNMQPLMGGADRARQARSANWKADQAALNKADARMEAKLKPITSKVGNWKASDTAYVQKQRAKMGARQAALNSRYAGYSKIQ